MSQLLPPDVLRYRHFIMYDALAKRDPFEAYKTFCKATKYENYDYVEYEYWYYFFYNGNTDMDHDRSLDPIQTTICELPNEMLNKILENLDFHNRAQVRKVCSKFHATIDQLKTQWRDFRIEIDHERSFIKMDAYEFEYLGSHNSRFSTVRFGSNLRKRLKYDWLDCVFSDLEIYLKPSRVEIENLCITLRTSPGISNRLIRLLTSSGGLFNVKSVHLFPNNCAHASRILVSLQPETLESIHLNSQNRKGEIEKIIQLEQFKRAKCLKIQLFANIDPTLLCHFYHLKTFDIRSTSIDAQSLIQIRENLSNNSNFEECEILSNQPLNLLEIGTALGATVQPDQKRLNYSYLQNGGTLEFILTMNCIRIRRSVPRNADTSSDDSSDWEDAVRIDPGNQQNRNYIHFSSSDDSSDDD